MPDALQRLLDAFDGVEVNTRRRLLRQLAALLRAVGRGELAARTEAVIDADPTTEAA